MQLNVLVANTGKLVKIFKTKTDTDYKPVPDDRYTDINPKAQIVKDVNIGENGEILSCHVDGSKRVLIKVDIAYAPGEDDPLEVYPCASEYKGKKRSQEQSAIGELRDTALRKYSNLFMAIDDFNKNEVSENQQIKATAS